MGVPAIKGSEPFSFFCLIVREIFRIRRLLLDHRLLTLLRLLYRGDKAIRFDGQHGTLQLLKNVFCGITDEQSRDARPGHCPLHRLYVDDGQDP
jgi:hypothetical protein